jgi:hypothetical protein
MKYEQRHKTSAIPDMLDRDDKNNFRVWQEYCYSRFLYLFWLFRILTLPEIFTERVTKAIARRRWILLLAFASCTSAAQPISNSIAIIYLKRIIFPV